MKKYLIYYFSGTGNAKATAEWISRTIKENGYECRLVDISLIDRKNIPLPQKDTRLGFMGPTHGFNFPPILFHFLLRFPKVKGNKAFIINTRAGLKMGKIFLPGLGGMALYFSALILMTKSFRIVALKGIDLPSNWISFHPGIRQKVVDSIIKKRKAESIKFAENLLADKRIYRGLYPIIIDLLITPIAILYYLLGRFFLAKTFIASSDCTNCGLCESTCPVNAIKIIDSRRFWTYRCESCMKCMNNCPERAIETAHGFVILLLFFLNGTVLYWLNKLIPMKEIFEENLTHWMAESILFIVNNLVLIFMIFISYRIVHFLMRFKVFERIITLSSLSHYKFWRRYKPKWKDYK